MEKEAIKDILYGGLSELMNNEDFYYRKNDFLNDSFFTFEQKHV